MSDLFFSIIIPTYNASSTINLTLDSIFNQTYQNFEIIISDDCSKDNTLELIKKYNSKKIKIFINEENLGYGPNLELARTYATHDHLFIISNDDMISKNTLKNYAKIYSESKKVKAIVRPFIEYIDFLKPVRVRSKLKNQFDTVIVNKNSNINYIYHIFYLAGNLSGLSYINSSTTVGIHKDIWPAHIYPFADILHNHSIAVYDKYNTAVKLHTNQSTKSFAYDESPSIQWIRMFENVFKKNYYLKNKLISNFVGKNYIGLIQIKNFGGNKKLIFEIMLLLKINKKNILNPFFWFFSIGTLLLPSSILHKLVIYYKKNISVFFFRKHKLED